VEEIIKQVSNTLNINNVDRRRSDGWSEKIIKQVSIQAKWKNYTYLFRLRRVAGDGQTAGDIDAVYGIWSN